MRLKVVESKIENAININNYKERANRLAQLEKEFVERVQMPEDVKRDMLTYNCIGNEYKMDWGRFLEIRSEYNTQYDELGLWEYADDNKRALMMILCCVIMNEFDFAVENIPITPFAETPLYRTIPDELCSNQGKKILDVLEREGWISKTSIGYDWNEKKVRLADFANWCGEELGLRNPWVNIGGMFGVDNLRNHYSGKSGDNPRWKNMKVLLYSCIAE